MTKNTVFMQEIYHYMLTSLTEHKIVVYIIFHLNSNLLLCVHTFEHLATKKCRAPTRKSDESVQL